MSTVLLISVLCLQEEQLDLVSLGSSIEEEDSPLVFLEKVHLFRERVEALVKAPLPSITALSITPRAAEYLQEHWHDVTVGELEDGPIPRVCCSAKPGGQEAGVGSEAGGDQFEGWVQDLWLQLLPTPPLVLVGLLLLMAALWINPVGGASLGFSFLSQLSQLVHGLSSELTTSLCEKAGLVYREMEEAVERCSSVISTLWGNAYQQLAAFYKTYSSS